MKNNSKLVNSDNHSFANLLLTLILISTKPKNKGIGPISLKGSGFFIVDNIIMMLF